MCGQDNIHLSIVDFGIRKRSVDIYINNIRVMCLDQTDQIPTNGNVSDKGISVSQNHLCIAFKYQVWCV